MHILIDKFKEVLSSVIPITIIVLVLHFCFIPLPTMLLIRFIIGAILIIIGLSIFLLGVDLGITPLGRGIGNYLPKSNKLQLIVIVGLVIGFFISVAEPDLQILAHQVSLVTKNAIKYIEILVMVSVGIGILLVIGLLRILYNIKTNILLTILYGVILLLALFVAPNILAISFDASGATTGALTVPFILAIAAGVSALKKNSVASEEDSFGLVGICSTGAIIGVLLLGILKNIHGLTGSLPADTITTDGLLTPFIEKISNTTIESAIALSPLLVICLVFQFAVFKYSKKKFRQLLIGLLYNLIGLVMFLVGVNAGFMNVGNYLGKALAENKPLVVAIGFVIGLVTILAEPAVHVLTKQIEEVTGGYIRKQLVLSVLSVGVGIAVGISVLRVVIPQIQLWHYLLPGYIISITLSYMVDPLFVGIGFDSGGVASGPMTATFILAFVQGVASGTVGSNLLNDSFGMIAMVAMTPIITLQLLGLAVKMKRIKGGSSK